MHLSMWTYPWDIQDQGLAALAADLCDRAGLTTVSLATSYHAGRFLQPRSPRQKAYFPEDGTVYFRPDESLWRDKLIQPLMAMNVAERGDMLEALVKGREATGLKVSCWTVCLHNSRLGMLHPDHVTRNAFGNPNYYNLCPSSPAARDYAVTLVRDITTNYQPDMVELESPNFMGFAHEYHHEKDGVGLNAEDDFLLSLCFCDHCTARATKAGVPVEGARRSVAHFIAELCERAVPARQLPDFPVAGIDAFRDHPHLHAYLTWRSEPVTSLIGEIKAGADPATRIVLIDLKDGWLGGVDLAAIGKLCDGAILCCYDMEPDAVGDVIRTGRAAIGPGKFLGVGLRVFYPEVSGPAILAARAKAAVDAGADGVNFYNYGLIPAKRLDWVKAAVDAVA
ncbi:hypothetical protein ELI30_31650 (plasmid) [Rhizobium leguminosarum]|uniref:hypothetical protein n=1 Tax=Rhizobium leguminosarum TaxID=384 RepID=UPI001030F312|nr:hypothetical protein [Rhizobium leguminosarum]TAV43044.1 hypothetical protein ELI31_29855 [Rhizobium leguminosarum]TAV43408.1 hypothetical protein ELI32_31885 [Rhizobium leguminosarum]TAV62254.1 hypothetical protein ELI30_31650 [Rhizobium leguminosarum]TAX24281.1 hypothetical protein ELI06_32115 [Rhizobium leguminosarum]TAY61315.1 hypothetical protein ELH82_30220 [Rhizobium leguminosarum]